MCLPILKLLCSTPGVVSIATISMATGSSSFQRNLPLSMSYPYLKNCFVACQELLPWQPSPWQLAFRALREQALLRGTIKLLKVVGRHWMMDRPSDYWLKRCHDSHLCCWRFKLSDMGKNPCFTEQIVGFNINRYWAKRWTKAGGEAQACESSLHPWPGAKNRY